MKRAQMASLVDPHDLKEIWKEVSHLTRLMSPRLDQSPIETAYNDMLKLFSGDYPGYQACNTAYHDAHHTTDTIMATIRLMHGASTEGLRFDDQEIVISAISAIFHDAGYIQTTNDTKGTGAKYTACHIKRSGNFLHHYFQAHGFPEDFHSIACSLLACTGLGINISKIKFASPRYELLGKMLGTGDLLGQMADRNYLEKLLFLFYEFKEGKISGFKNEFDLLKKTCRFFENTQKRMTKELDGANRFMRPHFRSRWGIDEDLYAQAIDKHYDYLKKIVMKHPSDYRNYLRREALLDKLSRLF